jgi:hypothetical protein
MHFRIENFRNGAWVVRSEGPIVADTSMDVIRASADRSALDHPARAMVDGVVVYETKKLKWLNSKRVKALFGV